MGYAKEFLGMDIGYDYISIASKWLSAENFYVANVISCAVLRGLWLTRNDSVFNNQGWLDVKLILKRIWKLSMEWSIVCKVANKVEMKWLTFLEKYKSRCGLQEIKVLYAEPCEWLSRISSC
jgi:hypothetical protein